MSSPVKTITLNVQVLDAAEMMETRGIKRLPVVAADELVGILTQTDITRGLILLSPLRSVSDIMSRNVAMVDVGQAVSDAAQVMSERHISSVVVLRNECPVGIFTEKDVTRHVMSVRRDPEDTLVSDVMSSPLYGVPTTCSVLSANQKMVAERVRRLAVLDNGKVRGIISQTNIMRSVRAELERMDADRFALWSALTESLQHVHGEVAELGQFVRDRFVELNRYDPHGVVEKLRPTEAEITGRIDHIMNEFERMQPPQDTGSC
jgi:predicted transcriptional regulator